MIYQFFPKPNPQDGYGRHSHPPLTPELQSKGEGTKQTYMIETPMKNPNTHPGQGMAEIRAKTGKERAWEKKRCPKSRKRSKKAEQVPENR